MPRDDKRQQIMRAAQFLLKRRQIHQVTLDEVARRAKVGKGTIYLYFSDKEDLFFQTAVAGFDDLRALLEKKVPDEAPFEDRLRDACDQIDRFFAQRRSLMRVIQVQEGRLSSRPGRMRERWLKKRQLLVESVTNILRSGIEEGFLRSDLPPELLSEYLLSSLRTRAHELEHHPEETRTLDVFLSLFLDGVRAQRSVTPAGKKDNAHG